MIPVWVKIYTGKVSHVEKFQKETACGIALQERDYWMEYEPTKPICKRCAKTIDWYSQEVLAEDSE